jgi:hypothetical protein
MRQRFIHRLASLMYDMNCSSLPRLGLLEDASAGVRHAQFHSLQQQVLSFAASSSVATIEQTIQHHSSRSSQQGQGLSLRRVVLRDEFVPWPVMFSSPSPNSLAKGAVSSLELHTPLRMLLWQPVLEPAAEAAEELRADSVRRKRKKKMNKHKHRKRRKLDRHRG